MESKKQRKQTNIKQKQTQRYREQTGDCQRGEEWGDGQNSGKRVKRCKLLVIK